MARFVSQSVTFYALALGFLIYYAVWPSLPDFFLLCVFVLGKNRAIFFDVSLTVLASVFGLAVAILVIHVVRSPMSQPTTPAWGGPGKVLLFPCRTTHTRVFPKKHSFSYSYLVVGIPVGWSGTAGGMVSVEATGVSLGQTSRLSLWSRSQKAWYHVDAADYLERGGGHLGLRGKLDAYLQSQGIDPGKYPSAYLVTAAKFIGYQFNPVSFWYLYDAEKNLAAMILEVNNTFDERRMYFLPALESDLDPSVTYDNGATEAENGGSAKRPPLRKLSGIWPKDFHVSPFNSRKGSYSLNAYDVLGPDMQISAVIDNTIILRSSKTHAKLVARIFSEGPGIDPTELSIWQRWTFLARWWWVGFFTFPRIVKEAGVLFFRRSLHVWFRPEPLRDSIGRNADSTEKALEMVFRRYLRYLVDQSSSVLAVRYIPSGIANSSEELILSASARDGYNDNDKVEFKVLTPVFYSRFVYYANDLEALFCELRDNHTVWVSKPELLLRLVLKKPSPPLGARGFLDFISFKAIQRLRRRPERIERPLTSRQTPRGRTATTAEDIRGFHISSMDGFVLSQGDIAMKSAYRRALLKLFLADRVMFGLVSVLDAQQFVFRAAVAWFFAGHLSQAIEEWYGYFDASLRNSS